MSMVKWGLVERMWFKVVLRGPRRAPRQPARRMAAKAGRAGPGRRAGTLPAPPHARHAFLLALQRRQIYRRQCRRRPCRQ